MDVFENTKQIDQYAVTVNLTSFEVKVSSDLASIVLAELIEPEGQGIVSLKDAIKGKVPEDTAEAWAEEYTRFTKELAAGRFVIETSHPWVTYYILHYFTGVFKLGEDKDRSFKYLMDTLGDNLEESRINAFSDEFDPLLYAADVICDRCYSTFKELID